MKSPAVWLLITICNAAILGLLFTSVPDIDYSAFYAAGRVAVSDPHELFNPQALQSAGTWSRAGSWMPYCHLPHETIIWAPLSLLPYEASYRLWQLISIILLSASSLILARISGEGRWMTFLMSAAFVPVAYGICAGQDSVLLLFLLCLSLYLLIADRPLLAGLVLSFALFKPQVPIVVAVALFASRRYRASLGFAIGSLLIMVSTFVMFGNWIPSLIALTSSIEPTERSTKMLSFRGIFGLLPPSIMIPASVLVGVGFLFYCFREWRECRNITYVYSSAILAGSLVAFHFHIQDASIFLLPLAVLYKRGLTSNEAAAVIPLYCVPIVLGVMSLQMTFLFTICTFIWLRSLTLHSDPTVITAMSETHAI